MKKILILMLMVIVSVSFASAQKIIKNKVDKFTKQKVVETSKETLYSVNLLYTGLTDRFECALRKVDGEYILVANILTQDIHKYTEDSGITLLLDNDKAISLRTAYTGIGAPFAKGYRFKTIFYLSESDVENLMNHKVVSIRISYLGGYYDKDLSPKKQSIIMKMVSLLEKE